MSCKGVCARARVCVLSVHVLVYVGRCVLSSKTHSAGTIWKGSARAQFCWLLTFKYVYLSLRFPLLTYPCLE